MSKYSFSHLPIVGPPLSIIGNALNENTIANGDNAQVWQWAITTSSKVGFKFAESAAGTDANQKLVFIETTTASPVTPFQVNTAAGFCLSAGYNGGVTTRFNNGSSGAPTITFSSFSNYGLWCDTDGLRFSTSGADAATFTDQKNLILSNISTDVASMVFGLQLGAGTAASANPPSNQTAMWSAAGEWQYRTAATNEGAGQTNRASRA